MPTARTLANLTSVVSNPARPLITYYDQATGERTELSAITTANWVAKTSNFLIDELEAEPGTRIRLGLPPHWLRFVWILTAFDTGTTLVDSAAEIAVTGPDLTADEPQRVASSLLPFAARFATPPDGFWDMGIAIASQSDHFIPLNPPEPASIAIDLAGPRSQADLVAAAQPDARRILLVADPVDDADPADVLQRDVSAIINACLGDGSLVLAAGADTDQLTRLASQEGAERAGPIN